MNAIDAIATEVSKRDGLYHEVALTFGSALDRLARAYEADPDSCRDLSQEIHIALWRSLAGFDGRCSLRTWTYRVAHNVAASHVLRQRRSRSRGLVSLDEIEVEADTPQPELEADRHLAEERLLALIQTLKPVDRQVIVLYLEDLDAASIGEVTGLSAGNVATRIHRIKNVLVRNFHRKFHQGGQHAGGDHEQ
jgi:RNA polymerase sigma-70 factor (ECF subfamily)